MLSAHQPDTSYIHSVPVGLAMASLWVRNPGNQVMWDRAKLFEQILWYAIDFICVVEWYVCAKNLATRTNKQLIMFQSKS